MMTILGKETAAGDVAGPDRGARAAPPVTVNSSSRRPAAPCFQYQLLQIRNNLLARDDRRVLLE
jgi:hypothetical protein